MAFGYIAKNTLKKDAKRSSVGAFGDTFGDALRSTQKMSYSSISSKQKRSTYMIEALLLFICIMMVVAVVMSVFAFAANMAKGASEKEEAIVFATNIAERFSADPMSLEDTYTQGDLTARCSMTLSIDNAGSFCKAQIIVLKDDEQIYSLDTAKYMPEFYGAGGMVAPSERAISAGTAVSGDVEASGAFIQADGSDA